jgi:hypothetical protein
MGFLGIVMGFMVVWPWKMVKYGEEWWCNHEK